jgi:phospholipase/carboxylesterase
VNPHLAHEPMLAGAPLGEARLAAVLVHGRDQGPEVMLDVAHRLELPGVGYVLPIAEGRSWYAGRYFDPVSENEPALAHALEAVETAVALAGDAGLAPERTVVGGFSQGACVIAELIARRPRRFAGAAVLTGALLGPEGEEVEPLPLGGLPMFFGSSRYDEWITLARAQSAADAFARAGAAVTFEVFDDREHHVSDRAVAGLRRLLERA